MPRDENGAVKLSIDEATPLLGGKPPEQESIDGVPQYESFGYMLLLLSALGFCIMGLLIRIATGYHAFPVPCVLFIRGVLQCSLALFWIVAFTDAKETFSLSPRLVGLLILRGLGGGTSMSLVFFGLSRVPMGIHASIFFLSTFYQPTMRSTRSICPPNISLELHRPDLHNDLLQLHAQRVIWPP